MRGRHGSRQPALGASGPSRATSDRMRERWNRRYAADDPHGSPVPSRFLVAEAAEMPPGRVLDLACGAGRNAVWLAERGWRVTAVDFSDVGLSMARVLARAHRVDVEWIEADVLSWTPAAAAFDLVCMLYLQLPSDERRSVLRRAADAVGPAGTLLVVGHDLLNLSEGSGGPTQPDVLFTPDDIVREMNGLRIEKAERVRRAVDDGGTPREAIDALVRARKL